MKVLSLVLSHLAILGLCFLLGRFLSVRNGPLSSPDPATKDASRTNPASARADEVLARFAPLPKDHYKELAKTLEPPEDYAATLADLVERFGKCRIASGEPVDLSIEQLSLYHEFHARLSQWLQSDKEACLEFLQGNGEALRLATFESPGALLDFLAEDGVLNNLEFFDPKSPFHFELALRFLPRVIAKQTESGASLQLLDQIETKVSLPSHVSSFILQALAPNLPFEERDALVERVLREEGGGVYPLTYFLGNPNHPQEELLSWYRDLIASDRLDAQTKRRIPGNVGWWLFRDENTMGVNERMALAMDVVDMESELAAMNVANSEARSFLNLGRDFRYEFRHGTISAPEVLQEFQAAAPDLFENNFQQAVASLYQELAEESPQAAIVILDELHDPVLAEEVRLEVSEKAFGNVEPDILLAHAESLPASASADVVWENRAAGLLQRHGEDFVEWIAQLPAGPQRDSASRWTIEAARGLWPENAEAIANRLNVTP